MGEVLYSERQAEAVLSTVWANQIRPAMRDGKRLYLSVEEEKRSNEQNKRMWAMLADISEQVNWHGIYLNAEDWKHVFSAALKKARVVPGIDGGFVVLGQSTSRMTKAEMSELQELMAAFGAEHEVIFKTDAGAASSATT